MQTLIQRYNEYNKNSVRLQNNLHEVALTKADKHLPMQISVPYWSSRTFSDDQKFYRSLYQIIPIVYSAIRLLHSFVCCCTTALILARSCIYTSMRVSNCLCEFVMKWKWRTKKKTEKMFVTSCVRSNIPLLFEFELNTVMRISFRRHTVAHWHENSTIVCILYGTQRRCGN